MKISTKSQFLDIASAGLVGNQLPSWCSVEAALADGYHGDVMIRYRDPMANGRGWLRANTPLSEVEEHINRFVSEGATREKFYLTHMSTNFGRRLNAEAVFLPGGLYLNYSLSQTHMRESLNLHGGHATGAKAWQILRWACDANSFDDLMILFDMFPDAVIELTAYDREIGLIPHRNTVIWEVREY